MYLKVKDDFKLSYMKIGLIFRLASFWIGIHYSKGNKRICINPIFCITIWITLKGGVVPYKEKM